MWDHGKTYVNGTVYEYWIKYYDEPSCFGIDGSRISKMEIRKEGDVVVLLYDRGWNVMPDDDGTELVFRFLMQEYGGLNE